MFSSLGLSESLLRAVAEKGYSTATPIQVKTIPVVLAGKDVMAAAQTGTGKTAGFTLPLLQRLAGGSKVKANHIRALILTPTRELAMQVAESVVDYGRYLSLKYGVVYGGVKINPQMMKLRGGVDVLVATPGRLLDLFNQNAVKFSQVEMLVLDEADRMLDMGFIGDIRKILALLPKRRQNLLFSATFPDAISSFAAVLLSNPVQIEAGSRNTAAGSVKQWVYEVDKGKKQGLLSHLVRNKCLEQTLVFTRTRNGADRLVEKLKNDGVSAMALHGDRTQTERSRILADFKADRIRVVVATDIAARGLDIRELPYVINFDLPKIPEDYIHRIGRTGRAGMEGTAFSLVSADEVNLLVGIETLIRQTLVREVENGFVPKHHVPLTRQLSVRPKKVKKPKSLRTQSEGRKESDNSEKGGRQSSRNEKSGPAGNAKGGRGMKGKQVCGRNDMPVKKNDSGKSKRSSSKKNTRGGK